MATATLPAEIPLCDPETEGVLLEPIWVGPRSNPLSQPPRDAPDAYLTLAECQELVDRVLADLGSDVRQVPVSWSRAENQHGRCRRSADGFCFEIAVSKKVFAAVSAAERAGTLIHEACHVVALLRGDHGHGPAWAACMRQCGQEPKVYATPVEELNAYVECAACQRRHGIATNVVGPFQRGEVLARCRGCGAALTPEMLHVPANVAQRVAKADARRVQYQCPCGAVFYLTPKAQADPNRFRCAECQVRMSPQHVVPVGTRVAVPPPRGPVPYQCPQCQAAYALPPVVADKIKDSSTRGRFACKACRAELSPTGLRRQNPTIGMGPGYFQRVLNDYTDWRQKWWREVIQNAVDARATHVQLSVVEQLDHTWQVACEDNGAGMSRDTLLGKFLRMGESTKTAEGGTAGGFGKAKELILFPWKSWEIHSQDVRAFGAGSDYEVAEVPVLRGTRVSVIMTADQHTHISAALAFVEKCHLPGITFTLRQQVLDGPATSRTVRPKLVGAVLVDELPGKATVRLTRTKDTQSYLYVRTKGLFMFEQYVGKLPGYLILDITVPSIQVMVSNRDGISDPELQTFIAQFVEKLSKDTQSALRARYGDVRKVFKGSGRFRATAAADTLVDTVEVSTGGSGSVTLQNMAGIVAEVEQYRSQQHQEDKVGVVAAAPTEELVKALLESVDFTGAVHARDAVQHLVWTPDFLVYREIEAYRVPKKFHPEHMTPRVFKLAKVWTELCRFVLMTLGCTRRPYGVGWIFSEYARAAYDPDDGGWLLLNPFTDIRRRTAIYGTSGVEDLKLLYALAIHEVTHLADGISYHDESFVGALTQNMAKCADGWRKVRGIVRAIRQHGAMEADVEEE